MKKKILVILSIFTLLFLVSCGSTPEEEPVTPEAPTEVEEEVVDQVIEEIVEEVSQEEVDAIIAEIDAARSRALQAGAETKSPSELKEIDELFASVKEDKTALKNESSKIVGLYDALVSSINEKEAEASLFAAIDNARADALASGAEEFAAEELKKLDDYVASVKADKDKLTAEGGKLAGYYQELAKLAGEKKDSSETIKNINNSITDARNKALEAGVEGVIPETLKQLDDYVATLQADKEKLIKEGSKVPGYYDSLIKIVNDIQDAEKLSAEIDAARERAIAAGVEKVIPEELKELDEYVEALRESEDAWKTAGPNVPGSYDALIVTMNEKKAEEKLLASIETARNKAIKAGAEDVASEELKRLDEYFASVRGNKDNWKAEGPNVPGYYDSLTKFVNDEKIAANILVNIKTSRAKAVEAGAETKTADILKRIDEYVELISGNSNSVKNNGHKASNAYKSLVPYIGATDAKKIVDEENLASYAQTYYERAGVKLAAVESAYKDIDDVPQNIISDATDARRDYRNVINVAYKDQAKAERELAYAEKKNADKVRAGVTQKDRYRAAVADFKKGDSLYSMQDAKNAIGYYRAAKEEFAALYGSVSEEMLAALAAIEAAKKDVAESSQYAEEADEMAPITGKNIEGIEDEDTVLLEADNYEDPNASVIAVDEVVEVTESDVVEEESEELVADEQYVEEVVEEETEEVVEDTTETETPAEPEVAETTEPEITETETAETETVEPEVSEPESTAPEAVEPESTEQVEVPETESVPESTEESSEDVVEAPVITDEVVTDSTAATEENEVTDVTFDVEVTDK